MRLRVCDSAFTLVELVIVVLVVGILASLAVPIMRSNAAKAIATEGQAVAGAIRAAERVWYAEHGAYTGNWDDLGDQVLLRDNKYFVTAPTLMASGSGETSTFAATLAGSGDAAGIVVTVDYLGALVVSGL